MNIDLGVSRMVNCYSSLLSYRERQWIKRSFALLLPPGKVTKVNGRKVLFVHIPKAAGMSICTAMFGREVGHDSLALSSVRLKENLHEVFVFTFVRNPYDRLVSAYCFLRQGGMKKYCTDAVMSDYINEKYSNFDSFVLNALGQDSVVSGYYHFVPQIEFLRSQLFDQGGVFVGKVEQISYDFEKVNQALGTLFQLGNFNKTKHDNWQDYYQTRGVKEKVQEVYAEDFQRLGYEI